MVGGTEEGAWPVGAGAGGPVGEMTAGTVERTSEAACCGLGRLRASLFMFLSCQMGQQRASL